MRIGAKRTSVTLEPEFWNELERIARTEGLSLARLFERVDNECPRDNGFASALRVFALKARIPRTLG